MVCAAAHKKSVTSGPHYGSNTPKPVAFGGDRHKARVNFLGLRNSAPREATLLKFLNEEIQA
jgi:hypothetical protein